MRCMQPDCRLYVWNDGSKDAKQEQLDKWLDENGGATETPQSNLDTIAAAKEAN